MIISHTCKIAVRAAANIASRHPFEKAVTGKQLAAEIGENPHTVAKVLQVLVKHRLLSSSRGASGGFYFSIAQLANRIIDIVSVIDGKEVLDTCVLGLHTCSEKNSCLFHGRFEEVRTGIKKVFYQTNIQELGRELSKRKVPGFKEVSSYD